LGDLPDLTTTEWEDLTKRLTVYAIFKSRRLRWRGLPGGNNQSMPDGHGPDSLASEAILSVLNDDRKTCTATNRDELLEFLKGVVDSKVSHLVELAENRRTQALPSNDGHAGRALDGWHPRTKPREGPAALVADTEAAKAFQDKAIKALAAEPKLTELFECLAAGFTGRKEIAELMNVTEDDVTNLKQRLARKLEPLRVETKKVPHGRAGTVR
jgi:hypothetical protein